MEIKISRTEELDILEQLYSLRKRSEVMKYLANNFFLFPFLQDVYEQIRSYFGKSGQPILEVVTDPEAIEDQELVIFIHTTLSADEAIERLEQFDEQWWLNAPVNIRKKLCIDVEFE